MSQYGLIHSRPRKNSASEVTSFSPASPEPVAAACGHELRLHSSYASETPSRVQVSVRSPNGANHRGGLPGYPWGYPGAAQEHADITARSGLLARTELGHEAGGQRDMRRTSSKTDEDARLRSSRHDYGAARPASPLLVARSSSSRTAAVIGGHAASRNGSAAGQASCNAPVTPPRTPAASSAARGIGRAIGPAIMHMPMYQPSAVRNSSAPYADARLEAAAASGRAEARARAAAIAREEEVKARATVAAAVEKNQARAEAAAAQEEVRARAAAAAERELARVRALASAAREQARSHATAAAAQVAQEQARPHATAAAAAQEQARSHATAVAAQEQARPHATAAAAMREEARPHTTAAAAQEQARPPRTTAAAAQEQARPPHTTAAAMREEARPHTTAAAAHEQARPHATAAAVREEARRHATAAAVGEEARPHATAAAVREEPRPHATSVLGATLADDAATVLRVMQPAVGTVAGGHAAVGLMASAFRATTRLEAVVERRSADAAARLEAAAVRTAASRGGRGDAVAAADATAVWTDAAGTQPAQENTSADAGSVGAAAYLEQLLDANNNGLPHMQLPINIVTYNIHSVKPMLVTAAAAAAASVSEAKAAVDKAQADARIAACSRDTAKRWAAQASAAAVEAAPAKKANAKRADANAANKLAHVALLADEADIAVHNAAKAAEMAEKAANKAIAHAAASWAKVAQAAAADAARIAAAAAKAVSKIATTNSPAAPAASAVNSKAAATDQEGSEGVPGDEDAREVDLTLLQGVLTAMVDHAGWALPRGVQATGRLDVICLQEVRVAEKDKPLLRGLLKQLREDGYDHAMAGEQVILWNRHTLERTADVEGPDYVWCRETVPGVQDRLEAAWGDDAELQKAYRAACDQMEGYRNTQTSGRCCDAKTFFRYPPITVVLRRRFKTTGSNTTYVITTAHTPGTGRLRTGADQRDRHLQQLAREVEWLMTPGRYGRVMRHMEQLNNYRDKDGKELYPAGGLLPKGAGHIDVVHVVAGDFNTHLYGQAAGTICTTKGRRADECFPTCLKRHWQAFQGTKENHSEPSTAANFADVVYVLKNSLEMVDIFNTGFQVLPLAPAYGLSLMGGSDHKPVLVSFREGSQEVRPVLSLAAAAYSVLKLRLQEGAHLVLREDVKANVNKMRGQVDMALQQLAQALAAQSLVDKLDDKHAFFRAVPVGARDA